MNSMRAGWCISLGVHALGFGVLAYAGFFRHPTVLAGNDEPQTITFTVVAPLDDSLESPPDTKPRIAPTIPPQPTKLAGSLKSPEPENYFEEPTLQNIWQSPDSFVSDIAPEPLAMPSSKPVMVTIAQLPSVSPTKAATSSHSPDEVSTPQPAATRPTTIGERARPDYRKNPAPHYPSASLRRHEEGVVLLRVTVSAEGNSKRVEVKQSSGFPLLDQAAVEAVKDWEFDPARVGTLPVESEIEIPVRFTFRK